MKVFIPEGVYASCKLARKKPMPDVGAIIKPPIAQKAYFQGQNKI